MSIGGIQGRDVSAIRDQLQSFQQGKVNLQKSDLTELKSKLEEAGHSKAAAGIGDVIDSFDKIDQNKDGISAKELQGYAKDKGASGASDATPVHGVRGGGRTLSISIELERSSPRQAPQASEGGQGISKDDLQALKQKLESNGKQVPQGLNDLISTFDKTDGNGDGTLNARELLKKLIEGQGSGSTSASDAADEEATADTQNASGAAINVSFESSESSSTSSASDAATSSNASSNANSKVSGISDEDLQALVDKLQPGKRSSGSGFGRMHGADGANQGFGAMNADFRGGQSGAGEIKELLQKVQQALQSAGDSPIEIRVGNNQNSGGKGISKEDLEALKKKFESSGMEVPKGLDELLSSFDKTDGNSDGKLDLKELLNKLVQGQDSQSADSTTSDATSATDSTGNTASSDKTKSTEETDDAISTSGAAKEASSNQRIDWRALFKQDQGAGNTHPSSEGSKAPASYQRYISSYTQVSFAMSSSSFQTRV